MDNGRMEMRKSVIAVISMTAIVVILSSVYLFAPQLFIPQAPGFQPYASVSYIVFEDTSHNLLGNLTGELKIVKTSESTIDSTLSLTFNSGRLNHKPYINNITLEISFAVMFFEFGPPPPVPPPVPRNQSLSEGEQVAFYHASTNISRLKRPAVVIFFWIHSFQVHLSDSQKWLTKDQITIFNQYIELSELSGKTETETFTVTVSQPPKRAPGGGAPAIRIE